MLALEIKMKLFRRSNGYWYVRFERGKEKSLRTKDKRLAQKIFRKLQEEALKGRLVLIEKQEKISLSEFFEEYLAWSEQNKSSETVKKERWVFRGFLEYAGNRSLRTIRPRDVEQYLAFLKSKGRKPAGINIDLRHLKAAFSKAQDWGYIKENPCSRVKPLKVPATPPRFLSKEEARKLLETIKARELDFYHYVRFLLETGCRRNEALFLRWEDIDWANRRLYVRGKGNKVRFIPIHSSLADLLQEMGPKERGRLFPWAPSTVTHKLKRYFRELGLDYRLHDLRHTTASWLAMKGVPLKTIQELLGHSTIAVTEIYAHLQDEAIREALECTFSGKTQATDLKIVK